MTVQSLILFSEIDASSIKQTVTWGTSPEEIVSIDGVVPDPEKGLKDDLKKEKIKRSLEYIGVKSWAENKRS